MCHSSNKPWGLHSGSFIAQVSSVDVQRGFRNTQVNSVVWSFYCNSLHLPLSLLGLGFRPLSLLTLSKKQDLSQGNLSHSHTLLGSLIFTPRGGARWITCDLWHLACLHHYDLKWVNNLCTVSSATTFVSIQSHALFHSVSKYQLWKGILSGTTRGKHQTILMHTIAARLCRYTYIILIKNIIKIIIVILKIRGSTLLLKWDKIQQKVEQSAQKKIFF